MKLKEMMKLDANMFKSLSIAEKIKIVESLQKIANKRIDALEKSGLAPISNALHSRNGNKFPRMKRNVAKYTKMENAYKSRRTEYKKSRGKLPRPSKNKKLSALEENLTEAFGNVKGFLGAKSSTISGASKTLKKASKEFASLDELKNASKAQQNKFWDAYNRLKDLDPGLRSAVDYEILRQMLFDIMMKRTKNGMRFKNIDSAIKEMEDKLRSIYEEKFGKEYVPNSPMNKKLDTSVEDAPFKIYGESMSVFGDDDDD